jgi:hypothetical protein
MAGGISNKRATDGVRALVCGVLSSLQMQVNMAKAGSRRISGDKEVVGDNSNSNL